MQIQHISEGKDRAKRLNFVKQGRRLATPEGIKTASRLPRHVRTSRYVTVPKHDRCKADRVGQGSMTGPTTPQCERSASRSAHSPAPAVGGGAKRSAAHRTHRKGTPAHLGIQRRMGQDYSPAAFHLFSVVFLFCCCVVVLPLFPDVFVFTFPAFACILRHIRPQSLCMWLAFFRLSRKLHLPLWVQGHVHHLSNVCQVSPPDG